MTPAPQEPHRQRCCHYDVCYMINKGRECINDKPTEIPCIFDSRKEINFSRCPYTHPAAPVPDYRELFVSDLISLVRWDAEHGSPELFKAVHLIKQHYAKPFSEQLKEHDAAIAKAERERVLDELDALTELKIASGILYEFCEWFCGYDCEEKPCKTTISQLHERIEGIEKQMKSHPEYLAKWEAKRAEQKALRQPEEP